MTPVDSPRLSIACLCAAWCGSCRDYRPAWDALAAELPGHHWDWIDVEDEAERIGDLDLETFPTVVVAHRGRLLFGGPMLPRAGELRRLVEALCADLAAGRTPTARVAADDAAAYALIAAALPQP